MNGTNPASAASTRSEHDSGLRFAFYGRTSTTRIKDRVSSQGRQRDMAEEVVVGHGQVVVAYFDVGTGRAACAPHSGVAAGWS